MFNQILVLFALIAAATALSGWRDCGSHMGTIHNIRLTNCTHTPCTFYRGQSYEAQVDGTWRANSRTLPFVLNVVVLGIPINLLEGDACDYKIRGHCPALNADTFTIRSYYPIPENLPPVSTIARGVISNDYGDIGICLEMDVRLA